MFISMAVPPRSMEEVAPEDWAEQVYRRDIINTPAKVYKKPGYTM